MGAITQDIITDIERLDLEGNSIDRICSFTGRSTGVVDQIIRGQHLLQAPQKPSTKKALMHKSHAAIVAIVGERTKAYVGRGQSFLPTPQQIEEACLAIRETWSEAEHYNRRGT
jgi:hypothetical protein